MWGCGLYIAVWSVYVCGSHIAVWSVCVCEHAHMCGLHIAVWGVCVCGHYIAVWGVCVWSAHSCMHAMFVCDLHIAVCTRAHNCGLHIAVWDGWLPENSSTALYMLGYRCVQAIFDFICGCWEFELRSSC